LIRQKFDLFFHSSTIPARSPSARVSDLRDPRCASKAGKHHHESQEGSRAALGRLKMASWISPSKQWVFVGSWTLTESRPEALSGLVESIWLFRGRDAAAPRAALPQRPPRARVQLDDRFRFVKEGTAELCAASCLTGLQTRPTMLEAARTRILRRHSLHSPSNRNSFCSMGFVGIVLIPVGHFSRNLSRLLTLSRVSPTERKVAHSAKTHSFKRLDWLARPLHGKNAFDFSRQVPGFSGKR